jgi:hypothetical protein
MGYYNHPNRVNNNKDTSMGIGPHDYILYSYDANQQVTRAQYFLGGLQDNGSIVADVVYLYDGSGNLNGSYRQDLNPLNEPSSNNPAEQSTSSGNNPQEIDTSI